MSVLNPIVISWDGANRRAYLAEGVGDFYPIEDIYHEYRNQRRLDLELRKYDALLKAEGNVSKGAGAYTPRYVVLLDGFKLIPFNNSVQINQLGDMITDDPDTDATLYDTSSLTVPKVIYIKPSEAETIQLNSESIVFSSFQGAVWVDVTSSYSDKGSASTPNGNTERPVNTMALAVEIANERGFRVIQVIGDITLDTGDNVEDLKIIGTSHVNSNIIINAGAQCLRTSFESFDIEGVLDGDSEITNCIVGNLSYFNGHIHNSLLRGTIILAGDADATIDNCKMLNIMNEPIIDCGVSSQNLIVTNWSGRLVVKNCSNQNQLGIGCDAGDIFLDSTNIGGIIAVSGTGEVLDETSIDCYVISKIIDGTEIANLQRIIEFLRPHHTSTGNVWFWDPYSGNDSWDGKHPDRAFKTFQHAHGVAGNANHDTIMCVPGNPSGLTIATEAINITKDYLFLRGPGRDFNIVSPNTTIDTITISGRGVEVSGMRLSTGVGGDNTALYSTGTFTLVKNVYIYESNNGIEFHGGEYSIADNVKSHHGNGFGIKVSGTAEHIDILDCHIGGNGNSGIIVDTVNGHEVNISGCMIHKNTGYGIDISATSEGVIISQETTLFGNTLGEINDLGIGTYIDLGGDANIASVAGVPITSVDDFKADLSIVPAEVWNFELP